VEHLAHGYTNETSRSGSVVEGRHVGRNAEQRRDLEWACLDALHRVLPVPEVIGRSGPAIQMTFLEGDHGQDLIDTGGAGMVLRSTGALLARVQEVPADIIELLPGSGDVLVHGDFGPQNLLLDGPRVTALLDWEFAHVGSRIEDLAWAE
jgi:aminoglycoside phosphotransferase (APT) family kinase protein